MLTPERTSDILFKVDISKLKITDNSYFFIPNEKLISYHIVR